jgi:hypothetical protein
MQLDFFESSADFLADQQKKWRDTIENNGGHCPCCGKWGKISPFPMTEIMALGLLWLSRATPDDDGWIDVPTQAPRWMLRGKTYTTMHRWGLIEKADRHEDKTKKSDGLWRITAKGLHFIFGTTRIPKKVFVYNNMVEGWSDDQVYFQECFGKHFDYEAVMAENFNFNAIKD